jgi:hypothetical protein
LICKILPYNYYWIEHFFKREDETLIMEGWFCNNTVEESSMELIIDDQTI